MSKADEVTVNVNSGYQADVRFAANQMSTSGGVVNGTVAINSAFGPKHAAAVTNDFSTSRCVAPSNNRSRWPSSLPMIRKRCLDSRRRRTSR